MRSAYTDGDGIAGTSAGSGRGGNLSLLARIDVMKRLIAEVETPVLPGQVCPTCGEKTPSERALKMREWRAKRGT